MNLLFVVISLLNFHVITSKEDRNSDEKISWVEQPDDIFFDRVVFIAYHDEQPITTGIFITRRLVLTSFNPFRAKFRQGRVFPKIIVLLSRTIESKKKNKHETQTLETVCAEQVVPIREEQLHVTQWHGTDRLHSPVHDLMVLRIKEYIKFLNPDPSLYSFDYYPDGSPVAAGPFVTKVALPEDYIYYRGVKFASLGFKNKTHMLMSKVLSSREYEEEENCLDVCDEWFPSQWGHFICVSNIDHYGGVGSGAVLAHNDMVFGIGSFLLKKSNRSILVFTDVRPYFELLNHTCPAPDYLMTDYEGY